MISFGHVLTAVKTLETKASSFDFQFVNSTDEVRKILTSLTGNNKSGDVIVVTHPDDLSRDHLFHRLQITEDGHPDLMPGKLFESDPQRVPGRSHQIHDSSVNVENKQEMPDISLLSSGKKMLLSLTVLKNRLNCTTVNLKLPL